MTPPTTDDVDRAEEDARRADAKRERLYTWIVIILGILGGGVFALVYLCVSARLPERVRSQTGRQEWLWR